MEPAPPSIAAPTGASPRARSEILWNITAAATSAAARPDGARTVRRSQLDGEALETSARPSTRRARRAEPTTSRARCRSCGPLRGGPDPLAWGRRRLDTARAAAVAGRAERTRTRTRPSGCDRRFSLPDAGEPLAAESGGGGGGGGGAARGRAGAAPARGRRRGASERDLDDVRGLSPGVTCQILRKRGRHRGGEPSSTAPLVVARARAADELHRAVTRALHVRASARPSGRLQRKIGRAHSRSATSLARPRRRMPLRARRGGRRRRQPARGGAAAGGRGQPRRRAPVDDARGSRGRRSCCAPTTSSGSAPRPRATAAGRGRSPTARRAVRAARRSRAARRRRGTSGRRASRCA